MKTKNELYIVSVPYIKKHARGKHKMIEKYLVQAFTFTEAENLVITNKGVSEVIKIVNARVSDIILSGECSNNFFKVKFTNFIPDGIETKEMQDAVLVEAKSIEDACAKFTNAHNSFFDYEIQSVTKCNFKGIIIQ